MKESIKNKILLSLELGGLLFTDMLLLSRKPYSSSVKIVNKRMKEVSNLLFPVLSGKERSLRNVIYKLKKDGLIEYKETGEEKKILITQKGRDLITKNKDNIGFPEARYLSIETPETKKTLSIIIFDIPEKDRNKRAWLRSAMKNIGFKQLQQSVWAGNVPIPEDFLNDLKELKILKFVEVFSVGKRGTIEKQSFE